MPQNNRNSYRPIKKYNEYGPWSTFTKNVPEGIMNPVISYPTSTKITVVTYPQMKQTK